MTSGHTYITNTATLGLDDTVLCMFFNEESKNYPCQIEQSWQIGEKENVPENLPNQKIFIGYGSWKTYFRCMGLPVYVILELDTLRVYASGDSIDEVKACLEEVKKIFTPLEKSSGKVTFSFWSKADSGARVTNRDLVVPTFETIRNNYAASTRDHFDYLVSHSPEEIAALGKLILWTGETGTGKTYAIRALAREWQDKASFDYILDAEQFFGSQATYMMDVLLRHQDYLNDEKSDNSKKYRVILMEDVGELMTADARERAGGGLARLLNVTEGLIGQGMKIFILITSNEDISQFHPAVSRMGRNSLNHTFGRLAAEEAAAWVKSNGSDVELENKPYTLAELYGKLNKAPLSKHQAGRKLGF